VVAEVDRLWRFVMILFYYGIGEDDESSSNLPLSGDSQSSYGVE